jgi:pilus assembly protein Flp/PilA
MHPGQRAQSMVEYAIIIVLLAVVVIVILALLGNHVHNVFYNITHMRGLNPCSGVDSHGQCL